MVTVSTRPEPGSKVVLEIEVPSDEVDRHFATAYRHVAERTKVPGFRPGKAPRQVIDRFVGRNSVLAEAMDHLVSDSYDRALDQTTIIPIDQPQVDIDPASLAEGQSITFTATVPVRPDVELGSYTGYPFELETPDVTDEQVEQVIGELREQQATLRPIDGRVAQKGDIASVKFAGTIGGEPFEGGSADRLLTYARGETLSEAQLAVLESEKDATTRPGRVELETLLTDTLERAFAQIRSTNPESLDEPRGVGRQQLPSTVRGLLFHAAEHGARHAGQAVTTMKIVRSSR